MSDENDDLGGAGKAGGAGEGGAGNQEAEKTAARFGWKPQDQWTGDAESWVDAETFLSRGKEYNGFLRKENERLNGRLTELEKSMQEFAAHHRKVAENAYKQAVADLKNARKEAIRTGDTEAQLELEEKIEELSQNPPKELTEPQNAGTRKVEIPPEHREVFDAWTDRNPWFGPHKEATEFANDVGAALTGKVTGAEFLKRVERAVRAEFPQLFTNPNRSSAGAVDTGGTNGASRGGGKSYSDLPPEAKAACDKFVKNKWTTREQYVKEFFEEA